MTMDPLALNPRNDRTDEEVNKVTSGGLLSSIRVRNDIVQEESKASVQPLMGHHKERLDRTNTVNADQNSRDYVCPYCTLSFAYKHVLERHVAQIHEKHLLKTLHCPKCTYTSVRRDQMRAHFSVVHEDFKPFNCSECNFRGPKAYRVTAHIQKNHGGVGTVIHNTQLKPRPVSPPSEEQVVNEANNELVDNEFQSLSSKNIQYLSSSKGDTWTNKSSERRIPSILKRKRNQDKEEDDVVPFFCPYCDFNSDSQIGMGDHVVLNHMEDHIMRNAQAPDLKDCSLCHKKLATTIQLQEHVRAEHPDVLVI